MPTELEKQFRDEMLRLYDKTVAETPYRPTRFRNMVASVGGVNAAKTLINNANPLSGFTELQILGRMDLAVEALVIQPQWRELFTTDELKRAKKRLEDVGYLPRTQLPIPVPFKIGSQYTRKEIQRLIGAPETDGGDWATGHHREGNDTFIFATIGAPGRTGHQYNNHWVGDLFHWETKGNLSQSAGPVQAMRNPPEGGRVYIFTREADRDPFVFEGVGRAIDVQGDQPVRIVWELESSPHITSPGEVSPGTRYVEGAMREVVVFAYERDPAARRKCIAYYGYACGICGLDFQKAYGDIGIDFIHVHHLKPISESQGEHPVDPINDLRPVCPNCHAMLHVSNQRTLSIEELVERIRLTGWLQAVRAYCQEN